MLDAVKNPAAFERAAQERAAFYEAREGTAVDTKPVGVPGQGRLLLGLACGLSAKCPFDIALLKRVGGVNRRIAHGTTTFLPKHSGAFSLRLPRSTRLTFGSGRNHVVHATLYITLHRPGHPIIVIANRSVTIK